MRLVRYADDFVIMIGGTRKHAEALREEVAAVLAPMGLRLSATKTRICHIDEGFDFLGWRIQRRTWRNQANNKAIYTYPSKKALASIVGKVRRLTRRAKHRTLSELLRRLNPTPGGLVQLLSSRSIQTNLRLSGPLRHCASRYVVEETTPRAEYAHPGPSLPTRMGNPQRRDRDVPTLPVRRSALPLPGHQNPHTMGKPNDRTNSHNGMNTWRAGCSGSCTSGSQGRAGETHQLKSRKGAPVRPLHLHTHLVGVRFAAAFVIDAYSRFIVALAGGDHSTLGPGARRPGTGPVGA